MILVIKSEIALIITGLAVGPGAADHGLEPIGILTAHGVMQHHESPAPLEERFENGALFRQDIAAVLRVEDQHIGGGQLFGTGKTHGAVGLGPALVEERRPFLQKTGMIMLIRSVRFHARADEHAQGRGVLGEGGKTEQNEAGREDKFVLHARCKVDQTDRLVPVF